MVSRSIPRHHQLKSCVTPVSDFSQYDNHACFRISEALQTGLFDIIGESLPTSPRLKPITNRKELDSRKFLIQAAKDYNRCLIEMLGEDLCCVAMNPEDGCGTFSKCIAEAEKYVNQVEAIASEGWFLSGNE